MFNQSNIIMSKYEKWLKRIAKAIKEGRFDFQCGKTRQWHGYKIIVGPLFCSYGKIGYTIDVYEAPMNWLGCIKYDYEMETCTYDGFLHYGDGEKIKDRDLFAERTMYYAIITYVYGGQYAIPELSQADTTGRNRKELTRRMKRLCKPMLFSNYPVDLEIRTENDELVERWTQERECGPWKNTY